MSRASWLLIIEFEPVLRIDVSSGTFRLQWALCLSHAQVLLPGKNYPPVIPHSLCHLHSLYLVVCIFNETVGLCRWQKPSPLDIAGYLPSGSGVTHEDIIILALKHDLTAGNNNPLKKVSFFDHYGSDIKRGLREEDMTALLLQNNEVPSAMLYLMQADRKIMYCSNGFSSYHISELADLCKQILIAWQYNTITSFL